MSGDLFKSVRILDFEVQLPEFVDEEAFAGFIDMRIRKGKARPLTKRATEMILRTLGEFHKLGHDCNASLDQSTLNGWSDVWPAKAKEIPAVSKSDFEKTRDYLSQTVTEVTPERRAEVAELLKATRQKLKRVA